MVDTSFFINNGPFTLQQVAEICEAELQNAEKAGVTVNNINTMERAGAGEICFFYDKKAKAKGAEIKAEAIRRRRAFPIRGGTAFAPG